MESTKLLMPNMGGMGGPAATSLQPGGPIPFVCLEKKPGWDSYPPKISLNFLILMGPNVPLFFWKGMIRCRELEITTGLCTVECSATIFFFWWTMCHWIEFVEWLQFFFFTETCLIHITIYASFASYSQLHITWWFTESISIYYWLHFVYDKRMEQTILQLYQTIRCLTKMPLTTLHLVKSGYGKTIHQLIYMVC